MPALSPQQQDFANCIQFEKRSINLVARAGCGKTFALVNAAVETIRRVRPQDEIIVLVYNKAAAEEVASRLKKAGHTDWKKVTASTVHSAGFSAWRKIAKDVKVDDRKVLNIINKIVADDCQGKDEHAITRHPFMICSAQIKQAVSLAKQRAFGFLVPVGDRSAWYDLIDHFGLDDLPDAFTVDNLVEMALTILRTSIEQDYTVIDFDDMILAPLVHKARFWGKDWVLLDEAQDTNPARRALAFALMKARTGRMAAVGDDRQAIYGFTGADSDSMDIIAKELNSKTLPLNVTYRCPKAVVAEARKLVPDFTAHPSAPEGVVRAVSYKQDTAAGPVFWYENAGLRGGDAILCRNVKPLVEQAYSLLRAGIGCIVEGREIGQGLSGLATRWASVKYLPALQDKLHDYREREITKYLAKGREEKVEAIADKVDTLLVLIQRCLEQQENTVAQLLTFIDGLFGNVEDRGAPDVVRLCSGHKSKGREWRRVFILGRAKFCPSRYARKPWQLEQEVNIEYVMLTRAMEEMVDVVME